MSEPKPEPKPNPEPKPEPKPEPEELEIKIKIETKCKETIKELVTRYKYDSYMMQRIYNHIVNYLPITLDNEMKTHEKRINRINYLTNEQNIFIQVFLSKHKYYYLTTNNFFYEYDGKKYLIVKEDDVIHNLVSSISQDRILMQWKYKTKANVLKQIRDRSLFSSIPETDTIQNVLNAIYPSFFSTKSSAKHFLTIIGDNILKKNTHILFLVSQKMRQFLTEINIVSFLSIGISNIFENFITKYHENNSYENYRLLQMNEIFTNDLWRELLKTIGLDLLCVAVHYSKRYENSDKFMENKADEEWKQYVYYLKNKDKLTIVNDFCSKYIQQGADTSVYKIDWKNIHFLWKQFLSSYNLPNIIFLNSLKNMLKDIYAYDSETDTFCGITSKYLPLHNEFIQFWESTIACHNCDTFALFGSDQDQKPETAKPTFDNELEIEEVCSLFKHWSKLKSKADPTNKFVTITEENALKIIKHFFPTTEIMEDKYVLGVSCSLWDKITDIHTAISLLKSTLLNDSSVSLISFDDVYNYYYKYCNTNSLKFIVSKRFFEKYLYFKVFKYIVYDKFIIPEWLQNEDVV